MGDSADEILEIKYSSFSSHIGLLWSLNVNTTEKTEYFNCHITGLKKDINIKK